MPHKDKQKQLEVQRAHYERNKEKVRAKNNALRKLRKKEWQDYKKTLACVKCGQNHPATLDFHHVIQSKDNRKLFQLISDNAWAKVWKEVEKCVVLCANCHRIHHHDERVDNRKRQKAKKAVQSTHTHQATPSGQRTENGNETSELVQGQRVEEGRKDGEEDVS